MRNIKFIIKGIIILIVGNVCLISCGKAPKEELIVALDSRPNKEYRLDAILDDSRSEKYNLLKYSEPIDTFYLVSYSLTYSGDYQLVKKLTFSWKWQDIQNASIQYSDSLYNLSDLLDQSNGTTTINVTKFHFEVEYPKIYIDDYKRQCTAKKEPMSSLVLLSFKSSLNQLLDFGNQYVKYITKQDIC